MTYQGPSIATKIKQELAQLLKEDGYSSISQAIGVDVKKKI